MKSYKNIYPQIYAFETLYEAAERARKGKKETAANIEFHFHLEENLLKIQRELKEKAYRHGSYTTFTIFDPKTRLISAAPYRDRVVHHALCQVIEPLFEKTFIYDSYANRLGKGSHLAISRYQHFARKYRYVLKCDIRKFFPSLDHEILKQEIRWRIACPDTLWLIDLIIDNSNEQEEHMVNFPQDDPLQPYLRRRGLPIGNLTSQFWANVYMNRFDHFVKEELFVKGYLRYVDDFVLFSDSKHELHTYQQRIASYLQKLRLLLHPRKTQIYSTQTGVLFLGFKVFPHYRYVLKQNRHRYRRNLKKKLNNPHKYSSQAIVDGANSWRGHILFGQSARLESQTFMYLRNKGLDLHQRPSGSWWLVEQQ